MPKGVGYSIAVAFIIAIMCLLAPKTDAISRATLGFRQYRPSFLLILRCKLEFRSWYGNEIFRSYERMVSCEEAKWKEDK
jgi:hypothetical protein